MTDQQTAAQQKARAERVLECASIFKQGCGNAGPMVAGLGMPADPLDCDCCVEGFLNAVRASLDGNLEPRP